MLLILVQVYVGSIKDIGEQLKVVIPFMALIIAFFAVFEKETGKASIIGNYNRLKKNKTVNDSNKPLLRSLITMKTKQKEINLEQIYNMNKGMFTEERLLEKLYE